MTMKATRSITEAEAIQRGMAPSPFADAVAKMFISGVSAHTTAGFFKISIHEVAALVTWVCEIQSRRHTDAL